MSLLHRVQFACWTDMLFDRKDHERSNDTPTILVQKFHVLGVLSYWSLCDNAD